MASLLDQSLTPRGSQGDNVPSVRGPQSGVDYFGDVGIRNAVSMLGPAGRGRSSSLRRPPRTGRSTAPNAGARSAVDIDARPPAGTGMRPVTAAFPTLEGADSQQSLGPSETAQNYFAGGGKPLVDPSTAATALQVAGMAIPGLGLAGTMIRGAMRDQQSMEDDGTRDLSGFARAPMGMAGVPALGAEAIVSGVDAARRFSDDDPTNDPTLRTYLGPMANAAVSQFAPDSAKPAMTAARMLFNGAPRPQQAPGLPMGPNTPPGEGVSVKTQYAIEQENAAAIGAARAAAAARAANSSGRNPRAPGLPSPGVSALGGDLNIPDDLQEGMEGFDGTDENTRAMMDSVRDFENRFGRQGSDGNVGGGGGVNNSAGGGLGGSSSETRGFAMDGGMTVDEGFEGPGMPVEAPMAGPANLMAMGYGRGANPMGVQQGSAPSEQSVQARVQQIMRDPRAVQALVARPMALMQSGELTPDEVLTLGRVAEASMYNPALYPQLRQFVIEQGMTPLPPAFDPGVITNIMVIAKTLQSQMPATPAGQVPPTTQAQVEQPVPGFGNGGAIRGPGTGRSDSIGTINESSGAPVKVATDEYIIPAHVVRAKGREFFDNLLRRYQPMGQGE